MSCKIVRYVPYIFCCSVGIPILIVKITIHFISSSRRKSTNGFFTIVPGYLQNIIFFFIFFYFGFQCMRYRCLGLAKRVCAYLRLEDEIRAMARCTRATVVLNIASGKGYSEANTVEINARVHLLSTQLLYLSCVETELLNWK